MEPVNSQRYIKVEIKANVDHRVKIKEREREKLESSLLALWMHKGDEMEMKR